MEKLPKGPVGIKGVSKNIELGHNTGIIGQTNEINVVDAFYGFSQAKKLGLKIFQGVQVTYTKMMSICEVFTAKMIQFDKTVEVDLIVVGCNSITLVEVKSNEKEAFKAMEQLNKSKPILVALATIVGVNLNKVKIKQVVAVPTVTGWQLKKKAKDQSVTIFETDSQENENTMSELFKIEEIEGEPFEGKEMLMGTLAFLKCSRPFPNNKTSIEIDEKELDQSVFEGLKACQIVDELKVC